MKITVFLISFVYTFPLLAQPHFVPEMPSFNSRYQINGAALCATAKQTLLYLNKGEHFDPQVIHDGHLLPVPIAQVKATLLFICQHQAELENPDFVKQHFNFIRWYPDIAHAKRLSANKPLLQRLPATSILMTKYYVHLAKASAHRTPAMLYPLYALPTEEQALTFEEAEASPHLMRFKFGKQAILAGALQQKSVPVLAYLSSDDLESALMQGTLVADFGGKTGRKIFNVHRSNNIAYDRMKKPYEQERYWYFKEVDGIKGYGKDADHKITVNPEVTFAADLNQFGLGKVLMVQYQDQGSLNTRLGIFADTGGAFADNLYQVDFLAGSYAGKEAFSRGTKHLPDYVNAYFMILKKNVIQSKAKDPRSM